MHRILLLIIVGLSLSGCVSSYLAKLNRIRTSTLPQIETELAAADFTPGAPMYIRIFKHEGVLETWLRNDKDGLYHPYKEYKICAFSGNLGPKIREGDRQAPEGFYEITEEQLWPGSKYHLALNVGFPNEYDKAHNRSGSYLMIHGGCESDGCYAMTDKSIEEIYILVEQSLLAGNPSVPVHIYPFHMTHYNLVNQMGSPWVKFWLNLKQGYNLFERNHIPPTVAVRDGRYIFMDYYHLAQNSR